MVVQCPNKILTGDDLGFTLAEPPPASTTLSVILIGQQGDAKLGGREDRRGAALDKSAQAIAAAVAAISAALSQRADPPGRETSDLRISAPRPSWPPCRCRCRAGRGALPRAAPPRP